MLFYHVEKTGGSAVMRWLHKMANTKDGKLTGQKPRLTSLMDFTHTSCFFALHSDGLFPGYAGKWDPRRCSGPQQPPWQRAAVAVEFHAYSRRRYWEELVPMLPAMRARYAAANGTLITVAMFREPVSHVLSVYRMWPPSRRCKCGGSQMAKHAVPLPDWLPRASGLQAGSLTLDAYGHMRKGFHNLRGCETLAQGRARLQTFDVVGVMDCMRGLLEYLCSRMGWPCAEDAARLDLAMAQSLRWKPHGVASRGGMMREASVWGALDNLNASTVRDVRRAAACDKAMYDDAVRRLGLEAPAVGSALDSALCVKADYAHRDSKI